MNECRTGMQETPQLETDGVLTETSGSTSKQIELFGTGMNFCQFFFLWGAGAVRGSVGLVLGVFVGLGLVFFFPHQPAQNRNKKIHGQRVHK